DEGTLDTIFRPPVEGVNELVSPLATLVTENLISLTANVQETPGNFVDENGYDEGSFTERALSLTLLPQDSLLSLSLASATVRADAAVDAAITVTPAEVETGETLTTDGTGYSPESEVTVTYTDVDGNEIGSETVTTDADGNFTTDFVVPDGTPPGTLTVTAVEGDNSATDTTEVVDSDAADATDDAQADSTDDAQADATDDSTADATDDSTADASDDAQADASDDAQADADQNANASASAAASANADDDSNASAQAAAQAAAQADASSDESAAADASAEAAAQAAAEEDASSDASADVSSDANASAQAAANAAADADNSAETNADSSAAAEGNAAAAADAAAIADASTDASANASASSQGEEGELVATIKYAKIVRGTGVTQEVYGSGFEPGESVTATVHSTPFELEAVTANESGDVTFTFDVGSDFELGDHNVTLVGATSGEAPAANTHTDFTVVDDTGSATATGASGTADATGTGGADSGDNGWLPNTGSAIGPGVLIGALLLILLGSGLALVSRRRRGQQH